MKCHHCQTELSDSAVFCGICGTPVKHNRFCDKCGAELDAAASFCSQCGKHVEYVLQNASNSLEDTPLAACRSEIFGFGKSMSIPIGA